MKFFDIKKQVITLMSRPEIVSCISTIEFYRGASYRLPNKIKLNRLHDISKRRSVTSSNEIEGVSINKRQESNLFVDKLPGDTLEEKQLLGYNDALEHIFACYKYQELDESFIRYLHELEWKRVNPAYGGTYKDHQNYIREVYEDGNSRTVFIPVKPDETEQTLGNLVWQYNNALSDPNINRLILIAVFILDFLCIHPFNDGNGRVSRLLTTFLLLKSGYELDRYYSVSYLILKSLSRYYSSLEKSSIGWHEDSNDYSEFTLYLLGVIIEGYKKLDYILSLYQEKTKLSEKVLKIIRDSHSPITKADIEEMLFSNTRSSIEEALGMLVKEKKIKLITSGKYSKYWKM